MLNFVEWMELFWSPQCVIICIEDYLQVEFWMLIHIAIYLLTSCLLGSKPICNSLVKKIKYIKYLLYLAGRMHFSNFRFTLCNCTRIYLFHSAKYLVFRRAELLNAGSCFHNGPGCSLIWSLFRWSSCCTGELLELRIQLLF